ncbi:hypothetical protein [Gordoniibacillus kamchatkensis]|uniref:hypothetical protein n=1 Tax=Gordoniibacillus kamchatkensis TaxID=1590651 RepID=UPI000AB4F028|nr:hypothetical protein [Paenibacillus sp. VKM B-2647]
MDTGSYRFADLKHNEQLLQDIRQLESKLELQLGTEVALIAYAKGTQEQSSNRP